MAQIDPKVQAIIDDLNNRKPSGYQSSQNTTITQNHPVSYNNEVRTSITNQEFTSHPESRVTYSETVKRSFAPSGNAIERSSGGPISMEEWKMRHPETINQPIASITQEEWLARQNNKPSQIESITHEEWLTRQSRGPVESITHEEWQERQNRAPIQPISQEEWEIRQNRSPIQTITQEEWAARQNAGNNVRTYVTSSPRHREEVVKRSGFGDSYYATNMAPYDYRDFRPKDFTYDYREYKPVQYETYTQSLPERAVVYEQSRPTNIVQIEERREETTKQSKQHVILEGNEKKSNNWCC